MPKYVIYFQTGASATVKVEADDLEAAIDAAYEEVPSTICAQCGGWGQDWTLDLDGEWDVDETCHTVDGEYVETQKAST